MEYLKIRNWDKWQTYRKDRGQPPWIKIHRCVMRNPEWVSLTDGERGQLVAMWLLAADHDGAIPASPDVIQKLCFLSKPPDLNKFTDLDFIEDGWRQSDAMMASSGCQHDQPKAEAEKNRIENTCANLSKGKSHLRNSFAHFWSSYPKKKSKGQAEKAFNAIKPNEQLLETILSSIERAKTSEEWLKDGGQYIPYPATWLRAKGWEDEFIAKEDEDDVFRDLRARHEKTKTALQQTAQQRPDRDIFRDLGKRG